MLRTLYYTFSLKPKAEPGLGPASSDLVNINKKHIVQNLRCPLWSENNTIIIPSIAHNNNNNNNSRVIATVKWKSRFVQMVFMK